MAISPSTRGTGFWAATGASVFAIAYIVGQIFEWAGMLGSTGGPNAASSPLGIAVLLTPSLLLGPSFVVLMAALHAAAPENRKVFTLAGLAFAVMYATLTGMVYFVQLTFVAPRLAAGDTAGIELLLFVPYRSFLFAVDLLGYSLMSMATLIAAFALPAAPYARAARIAMIANGALLPCLAFQMFVPVLIWPAAMWAITFPAATLLLAAMFRKARCSAPEGESEGG